MIENNRFWSLVGSQQKVWIKGIYNALTGTAGPETSLMMTKKGKLKKLLMQSAWWQLQTKQYLERVDHLCPPTGPL